MVYSTASRVNCTYTPNNLFIKILLLLLLLPHYPLFLLRCLPPSLSLIPIS